MPQGQGLGGLSRLSADWLNPREPALRRGSIVIRSRIEAGLSKYGVRTESERDQPILHWRAYLPFGWPALRKAPAASTSTTSASIGPRTGKIAHRRNIGIKLDSSEFTGQTQIIR